MVRPLGRLWQLRNEVLYPLQGVSRETLEEARFGETGGGDGQDAMAGLLDCMRQVISAIGEQVHPEKEIPGQNPYHSSPIGRTAPRGSNPSPSPL